MLVIIKLIVEIDKYLVELELIVEQNHFQIAVIIQLLEHIIQYV